MPYGLTFTPEPLRKNKTVITCTVVGTGDVMAEVFAHPVAHSAFVDLCWWGKWLALINEKDELSVYTCGLLFTFTRISLICMYMYNY